MTSHPSSLSLSLSLFHLSPHQSPLFSHFFTCFCSSVFHHSLTYSSGLELTHIHLVPIHHSGPVWTQAHAGGSAGQRVSHSSTLAAEAVSLSRTRDSSFSPSGSECLLTLSHSEKAPHNHFLIKFFPRVLFPHHPLILFLSSPLKTLFLFFTSVLFQGLGRRMSVWSTRGLDRKMVLWKVFFFFFLVALLFLKSFFLTCCGDMLPPVCASEPRTGFLSECSTHAQISQCTAKHSWHIHTHTHTHSLCKAQILFEHLRV